MGKAYASVNGTVTSARLFTFGNLVTGSFKVVFTGDVSPAALGKLINQNSQKDLLYLKNKAEELKAVMEINKKMTENVAKKPIVQSWFEYR